jgi:hypothetical protein
MIRDLLGPECDPSEDLNFFRKQRARNTCVWIEMDSQFLEWFNSSDSPSSRILWLHGVPGSGKSVLASYIVNYMKDTHGVCCQYSFFKEGNVKRQSLSSLAVSLAAQVAGESRQFRSHLVSLTMVWGDFGDNLRRYPQALYETVPAVCLSPRWRPRPFSSILG